MALLEHNTILTQHLTNDMGMAQVLVRGRLMAQRGRLMAQRWTTEWHAINT